MGTSKSSGGSPGGAPMVPPWAPPAPDGIPPQQGPPGEKPSENPPDGVPPQAKPAVPPQELTPKNPKLNTPSPKAPPGRFSGARTQLGKFAKSGSAENLKQGVSSYVKSGLGGRKTATARFGSTANTAGLLYNSLINASGGTAPTMVPLERRLLEGRTADDIASAILEATRPLDGTQDAESSRASINDALSELMDRHPDVDLLNLADEQKELVVEAYVSNDLYRRMVLDVGNAIRTKAPSPAAASARFKEVKDYIRETIAGAFRRAREAGSGLRQNNVANVVRAALEESFRVFEDYI